jgi:hypothetical protein
MMIRHQRSNPEHTNQGRGPKWIRDCIDIASRRWEKCNLLNGGHLSSPPHSPRTEEHWSSMCTLRCICIGWYHRDLQRHWNWGHRNSPWSITHTPSSTWIRDFIDIGSRWWKMSPLNRESSNSPSGTVEHPNSMRTVHYICIGSHHWEMQSHWNWGHSNSSSHSPRTEEHRSSMCTLFCIDIGSRYLEELYP